MTAALLVAQLLLADPVLKITASGPPLTPSEAVQTLKRASPDRDLSRGLFPISEPPFVIVTAPSRRESPYGALHPREPLVREIPGIRFRLPRGWDRPTYREPVNRYREHREPTERHTEETRR
jgi:hypothetical protein